MGTGVDTNHTGDRKGRPYEGNNLSLVQLDGLL